MFWIKKSLFIIKFTCDKSKVITYLIVYGVFFNKSKLEKKIKYAKTSKEKKTGENNN